MRPTPPKRHDESSSSSQFGAEIQNDTHTNIVVVWATIFRFWFWKHIQICETIVVKMTCRLLKSDKNWLNRSQSLITYFENDANWSALSRFRFWIKNWNCETILVKMMSKNKRIALFFVYSFECTAWNTQKQSCLFIFWPIFTLCTPFWREFSHNFKFLFKIQFWPLQLDLPPFESTKS